MARANLWNYEIGRLSPFETVKLGTQIKGNLLTFSRFHEGKFYKDSQRFHDRSKSVSPRPNTQYLQKKLDLAKDRLNSISNYRVRHLQSRNRVRRIEIQQQKIYTEQDSAAQLIQKIYRGYLCRLKYQSTLSHLQSYRLSEVVDRMKIETNQALAGFLLRHVHLIIKIQSWVRGHKDRVIARRIKAERDAIIAEKRRKAAINIQRICRGSICRTYVKEVREQQYIEKELKRINGNLRMMRVKQLWDRRKFNWFTLRKHYGFKRHQFISKPLNHSQFRKTRPQGKKKRTVIHEPESPSSRRLGTKWNTNPGFSFAASTVSYAANKNQDHEQTLLVLKPSWRIKKRSITHYLPPEDQSKMEKIQQLGNRRGTQQLQIPTVPEHIPTGNTRRAQTSQGHRRNSRCATPSFANEDPPKLTFPGLLSPKQYTKRLNSDQNKQQTWSLLYETEAINNIMHLSKYTPVGADIYRQRVRAVSVSHRRRSVCHYNNQEYIET